MKNFWVIGDVHIKEKYLEEIKLTLDKIIEIISSNIKPKEFIVILGDVFDKHKSMNIIEIFEFDKFIKRLLSFNEKIFILVGNHDRIKNSCYMTKEHSYIPYVDMYDNLKIVYETYQWNEFLFVPYVPNGMFSKSVAGIDMEKIDCIFSHQEFRDLKMGNIISCKGDEIPDTYPHIINGHIHEYQKNKNVICVGSVYQVNFSESLDKAISRFSLEGRELKEERYECIVVKKIELVLNKDQFLNFDFNDLLNDNKHHYKIIIDAKKNEIEHILNIHRGNPRLKFSYNIEKNNILHNKDENNNNKRKDYIFYFKQILNDEKNKKYKKILFSDIGIMLK